MSFFYSYETLLLTFIFESFLIATCLLGDKSLVFVSSQKSKTGGQIWIRAGSDSATHGGVALLSWAVVEMTSLSNITVREFANCMVCACLAVFIDLDHFIAAGSFSLQDAISLNKRPPFHATIIPVVFATLMCTGHVLQSKQIKIFSFIYLTSWLSHHIRDATRRGLWLPPFGSSPAIPYWMYIFLILFLPICVQTCLWYFVIYNKDEESGSSDFIEYHVLNVNSS